MTDREWIGSRALPVVPAKSLFFERREQSHPGDDHLTPSQTYGVLRQADYMDRTGNRVVLNLAGADAMRHVRKGDFISHLRSFQGGLEYSGLDGKVSAAYTVLAPRRRIEPRYYRYVFKSSRYVQGLKTTTDQLRDGQSIRYAQFALLPLPEPALEHQTVVADYLDRETVEIDSFISDQEELITLLGERRSNFVERELQRAAAGQTQSLGRVVHGVVDCLHESPEADDEGEYFSVRTSCVRAGRFALGGATRVSVATYRKRISRGAPEYRDVFFTREAPAGEACLVPDEGVFCLGQRMVLIKPDESKVMSELIVAGMYLTSTQDYFRVRSTGSGVQNITIPVLRRLLLPLPDRSVQPRLVARLRDEQESIDAAVADAREAIALSKERRAALISAAVTGQIDVEERKRVLI